MTQSTLAKANLIAALRSSLKDYRTVDIDSPKKAYLIKRIEGLQKELGIPFNEEDLN